MTSFLPSVVIVCAAASSALAETATRSPAVEAQLRWRLDDSDYDTGQPGDFALWRKASPEERREMMGKMRRSGPGVTLHATVVGLLSHGSANDRALAAEILRERIALSPLDDLDEVVSKHGIEFEGYLVRQESGGKVHEASEYNPQRLKVLNARDLALEYALLYLATGDTAVAERSREILLRFAEVIPHWPHYDRNNRPHRQGSEIAFCTGGPNGLWSSWYPKDLAEALPLLRAYDVIRPRLSAEEQERIAANVFVHHKEFIDRFDGGWPWKSYHNLGPLHLIPLLRFGQVLERPDYTHDAIRYWRDTLRYAYTPDGFWKELSPDYDQGVTARLLESMPKILKGYTDSVGYTDPVDGGRFDNLDLLQLIPSEVERMRRAFSVFALPNGVIAAVNDSWPNSRRLSANSVTPPGSPGLLGVSGIAKLGNGEMSAFLQFDGIRGHDHHDALNLIWFAAGREVFGDTGYQALPGSGSAREWHTITASHNTVAVDEATQFLNRGPEVPEPDAYHPYNAQPPATPLNVPVSAALPSAARYTNQGRLLLWDASSREVQAMEAEQEKAYLGTTSLYRRTIVLVPLSNSEGYLVDIFRIRGGKTHDFFLRGGLDWPYSMSFSAPLQKTSKTAYSYINITEKASIKPPLLATTRYEDTPGAPSVRSHLVGAFGSSANLDLLVGQAPAIRRLGSATFSLVRRAAQSAGPLETIFVWVHEATSTTPAIQNVKADHDGMNVTVTVELDNRTDTLFSGLDDASRFEQGDLAFTGRLGFTSRILTERTAHVFSGGDLRAGENVIAPGRPVITGEVLGTTRRDAKDETDSITIRAASLPGNAQPRLAHIDLGEVIRYSIPVLAAKTNGDQMTATLQHSPGFVVKEGEIVMTSFPGWRILGKATVRLE